MIACPNCRTILPVETSNTGRLHKCPDCLTRIRTELFNAFHRPISHGNIGEHVQEQGQAECFYHSGKKAVAPCYSCGRLLCALCEIPFDGLSLCVACLETGQNKQQIQSLEKSRVLYDSLALNLAIWPMIFFPLIFLTIITAPIVLFIVFRYWRISNSILPRTKVRYLMALLLSVAQIIGWVILLVGMIS